MAAYDSDIEDFEIDEETILDSEINMKFNEYNRGDRSDSNERVQRR